MDNSVFVGLSRQVMLRRELDIIANNLANSDTAGFKLEHLIVKTDARASATTQGGPKALKFVTADGVARDFSQAALRQTSNPLDVAIEGKGFFKVIDQGSDRFTRDGHFRTDETGKLVSQFGLPVADEGGGEITIDPTKGPVAISSDGVLSQGSERIGKIGVFDFDDLSVLEKTGNNLLQNNTNAAAKTAEDTRIRQGMLEGSNVRPVLEITRMIEVSRAYEQASHLMDAESDLSRRSIERMGRLQ